MKQSHEDRAKELAKYYFQLIAERAGVEWDSDNDAEIECLVNAIISASVSETLRIGDRRER